LVHRLGASPVRLQGGGGRDRRRHTRRGRVLRRATARAFGGYPREQTKYPVQYPTACSPQAWSTGTPLLLLRTMLGLEPQGEHLIVDPALPSDIKHLELLDIPGRWGRMDAFGRGRVDVRRHAGQRAQLGAISKGTPNGGTNGRKRSHQAARTRRAS